MVESHEVIKKEIRIHDHGSLKGFSCWWIIIIMFWAVWKIFKCQIGKDSKKKKNRQKKILIKYQLKNLFKVWLLSKIQSQYLFIKHVLFFCRNLESVVFFFIEFCKFALNLEGKSLNFFFLLKLVHNFLSFAEDSCFFKNLIIKVRLKNYMNSKKNL